MKRPLSLSHPAENRLQLVETAGSPSEQRVKREKKHQSFTLCEVCNIQLNSAAQAQIHYNGKSHQKRLKQLSKGKVPAGQGPSGHSSPLLASLSVPGRPLHPPLDIKHFLTFRFNGTSPLNLFPNFNTNQAEAHYKGHKHARRLKAIEAVKNKQKTAAVPSRDIVADFPATLDVSGDPHSTVQANGLLGLKEPDAECSSLVLTPTSEESSAELSSSVPALVSPPVSELSEGPSDAASVASLPALGAETPATESGSSVGSAPDRGKEGKKSKQHLYCPTCKVTVNSASQLEAHNTGAKHKSMLEGQTTQMRRGRGKVIPRAGHKSKRIGNKGSINIQNKAFHCQVCEIYVNSETQLKQHVSSRRHRDRLAGKPPKPKYSPYNKLQKNAVLAVSILKSKLALQKHLTKTLATRFLPSPLTTAAMCAMPGPLTLRPATATALFQAPLLGPALFRTPPGHVRATPGPIVFAPY
ncbi:zinc finger protein 385C isoform X4 [Terrapene carolina triunguis]|uniref:zinc finger protein 385C isoform X4 n=1 Tax=Terrapene triunguis TaxID=2587831 RepID=UPI0011562930|nr:zinc finger protein 385C isoform X4 [Terrapene carolina triunguis]